MGSSGRNETGLGVRTEYLALICFVSLGVSAIGEPDSIPSGSPRVLFPQPGAVLDSGKFEVIAVGPAGEAFPLEVNGKTWPWEPLRPPVYMARVTLEPGSHTLAVGGQKLDVFVGNGSEVDPAEVLRSHPPTGGTWKTCGRCHQVANEGGQLVLRGFSGADACRMCHVSEDIVTLHAHPEDPLEECQSCHDMHASKRPSLLKAPARELCLECHD